MESESSRSISEKLHCGFSTMGFVDRGITRDIERCPLQQSIGETANLNVYDHGHGHSCSLMSSVFVARLITAEGDALTCHVYLSGATVILGGARILCIVRLTVKHGLTDVRFDRISSIELRQEAANRNCHLRLQGSYVAKNAIPSLHTWVYKDVNSSLAKDWLN